MVNLIRTEQQYLLDADTRKVYDAYIKFWSPRVIPRKTFIKENEEDIDRVELSKEIGAGYPMIYKQEGIVAVDLLTSHGNKDHIDPKELSSLFQTTVIFYANWEDQHMSVFTNGSLEFQIDRSVDDKIEVEKGEHSRFEELYSQIITSTSSNNTDFIGQDLEKIFQILNIDIYSLAKQDANKTIEAFSYDFFGSNKAAIPPYFKSS